MLLKKMSKQWRVPNTGKAQRKLKNEIIEGFKNNLGF